MARIKESRMMQGTDRGVLSFAGNKKHLRPGLGS